MPYVELGVQQEPLARHGTAPLNTDCCGLKLTHSGIHGNNWADRALNDSPPEPPEEALWLLYKSGHSRFGKMRWSRE